MENNFKQWNLDQKRLEFKEQKRQIIAKAEQAKFEDEYRAFRAAQIAAEKGDNQ